MTDVYIRCTGINCGHASNSCTDSEEYRSKLANHEHPQSVMGEHETLAYALFTMAGKTAWFAAPPNLQAYYYKQADRLEQMLENHKLSVQKTV